MARNPKDNDQFSEPETIARREDALKRMLATPHKPHKPLGKKTKDRRSKSILKKGDQ
jgi:hypothetical protein